MITVRDLAERAYGASKVLGSGMPIGGTRMNVAVDILNVLLMEEFVAGLPASKTITNYTFNGSKEYTIGVGSRTIDSVDTLPDILVDTLPDSIDRIVLLSGEVRYSAYPMASGAFYGRSDDVSTNEFPTQFYYNRQGFGEQFPTISFIGNPNSPAEIVTTASGGDVVQSTMLNILPKAILPYLIHELSFRLANENGLDGVRQKMQSNRAYKLYQMSSDDTDVERSDETFSANVSAFGSADAAKGSRQINSGDK